MAITVTHADRIVFPATGNTKGDVVRYYERAADRILPHVVDRPLTLRRFPRGVTQAGFFQKNVPDNYPESMGRITIPKHGGVTVHPSVDRAEHLAFLANKGAIELHVPNARASDLSHPDRVVLDLDPPEGEVDLVRRAAQVVRDEFASFGLESTPVATGSKGFHVVASIAPNAPGSEIARAMHEFATLLAHRHPEVLTTAFRIAKRGGRVYADWLSNRVPATLIAPFSLRARPSPTLVFPFAWSELSRATPDGFALASADDLLAREDPLLALTKAPGDPRRFTSAVGAAFEEAGLVLEKFDRFRS